jgi:transcriptional regulator with XRE-family HTH domain
MNDISYTEWASMSDKALMEIIGSFVQFRRLNQNKSQNDVAGAAAISRSTLSLLEKGEKVSLNTLIKVLRVIGSLDIMDVFKVNNEISPVEYARLQNKIRQRARKKNSHIVAKKDLEW